MDARQHAFTVHTWLARGSLFERLAVRGSAAGLIPAQRPHARRTIECPRLHWRCSCCPHSHVRDPLPNRPGRSCPYPRRHIALRREPTPRIRIHYRTLSHPHVGGRHHAAPGSIRPRRPHSLPHFHRLSRSCQRDQADFHCPLRESSPKRLRWRKRRRRRCMLHQQTHTHP